MRKLIRCLGLAATLGLAASPAAAQTLFTGSGCAGNTFVFCGSWTGTYINSTSMSLFFTNTSGANAGNANSAFTQIGIGNVTVADPSSMGAVTGWTYASSLNGFNGFGLLVNQYGSRTTNGINNALLAGNSLTFTFNFAATIGTYAQALTAFSGAQIAIHDQGTPTSLLSLTDCASSKGVLDGDASGSSIGGQTCSVSTTPEPSTYVLLATGLVGVFGFARRRRTIAV